VRQAFSVYFEDSGNLPPPEVGLVSWLPFHHDTGLIFSICLPMFARKSGGVNEPVSFLQRLVRWMELLGKKWPVVFVRTQLCRRFGGANDIRR
jgi:acyl-CoA synthetase (AMP-forming)/AMP-acid ligase II